MTASHSTPPRLPDDSSWRTSVQHIWVIRKSIAHEREVGILLAWRRVKRGGWEGWVVYADPGIPAHGGGPRVIQEWVKADRIVRRE